MVGRLARPILAILFVGLAVWQTRLLLHQLSGVHAPPAIDTAKAVEGPFEVGVGRDGTLESADVAMIQVPEMLRWRSVITWIIPDSTEVKKGQVVAKLDVSEYRFEVDRQKLQYQDAVGKVGQSERNVARDLQQADQGVERATRSLDVLGQSLSTETEQGQAQVGFDQWNLTFSEGNYTKYTRLGKAGIVPVTDVEQAQRDVRAKTFAKAASDKNLVHLDSQHAVKKSQSASEIDTAKFEKELAGRRARDSVRAAKDAVTREKRQLDEMSENLANGELKAPIDGMVVLGTTWGETGPRTIREGDRAYFSVASISDPKKLQVALRIDEATASKLKVGQQVSVTAEGVPGRIFKAQVEHIGTVARVVDFWDDPNASANERVFDIWVKVLDVDTKVLRPGMKAKARFIFARLPKRVSVPLAAIIHRPGRGEYVYVKQGDRFVARKVKTGERNDEAVAVLSGLKPGERVALSDPTKIEAE
jgi:HlyD family secretion protein